MKRVTALAITTTLILTGCSNNGSDTPTPASTTSATSAAASLAKTYKEGDTITLDDVNGQATLHVTKITTSQECAYGENSFVEAPDLTGGDMYIQIWAEHSDFKPTPGMNYRFNSLADPEAITDDGFSQPVKIGFKCAEADDGATLWHDGVGPGEKKKVYGRFVAPDTVKQIKIEGHTFNLPDGEGSTPIAKSDKLPNPTLPASPADAAPEAPAAAIAPADPLDQIPADHPNREAIEQSLRESAGKTIDHCGDPGMHETGTTFFTDGTTGWTPDCANQMM